MINLVKFACIVGATIAMSSIAKSDPCSDAIKNSLHGHGLWALLWPKDSNRLDTTALQPVLVRGTTSLEADRFDSFVFVGRPTGHADKREGALTVKIQRIAQTPDEAAKEVWLRRGPSTSTCRPFFFDLFGNPFQVGLTESVGQFVRYHITNRNGSSTIQHFHIWYNSSEHDCVRTDSTIDSRRTAFLSTYEGEPLDPGSETIAWFGNQVVAPSYAETSPEPKGSRIAKQIEKEVSHLKQYSHIEAQVMEYPLRDRACAVIRPQEQLSGNTSLIEVSDLDAKRAERRAGSWTVKWR